MTAPTCTTSATVVAPDTKTGPTLHHLRDDNGASATVVCAASPPCQDSQTRDADGSVPLEPATDIARPYLKLLMPEPPSDRDMTPEQHREQVRGFNFVLFARKRNKQWWTIPVFSDDDEDLDSPLSPLLAREQVAA